MFKKIKEAYHNELLKRKLCTGCTGSLDKSVKRVNINSDIEVVTCRCSRKYIYEKTTETYKKYDEKQHFNAED